MLSEKQYSVSLIRLTVPPNDLSSKITLSVKNLSKEIFIAKEKAVKHEKAHFYRQVLFLSHLNQGITFNLYSVSTLNDRRLTKSFQIQPEELTSIDKRAAMFHTQSDGYELVWECCVFNASSETENQQTDREYSQFKLPMRSGFKELQLISKKSHMNSFMKGKADPYSNKRTASAESSSFRNETIRDDDWTGSSAKGKKRVRDDTDSPQRSQNNKQNSQLEKKGLKKLFSYFQGGISNLFSSARV